jgi:GNAT superfamily N-acetyltransferase
VSVQLEALADEVFDAACDQARLSGEVLHRPFGDLLINPDYPDLEFMNSVDNLIARAWSVSRLESAVREAVPAGAQVRLTSRDPETVATLGAALSASGYRHEVRIAMVAAFAVPRDDAAVHSVIPVDSASAWSDFEAMIHVESRDDGWTPQMTEQYIRLCRWRAGNTAHRYYLLDESGHPLSRVGLFQSGRTVYLHGLYTRPDARRRGAGAALMLAMGSETQRMGSDRLVLQTVEDGHLPQYYARLGYRPVGEQHLWTRSR